MLILMILGIIIIIAKHNDNNDDGKKQRNQRITVPWGSFFFSLLEVFHTSTSPTLWENANLPKKQERAFAAR